MENSEIDGTPAWLRHLAGTYRGIRFGRGVVGKTSYAAMGVITLWMIIVWRLSENLALDAGLFVSGIIVTSFIIWWINSTQKFAERNPAQAMLDGGELIEYQKFEARTKGEQPFIDSVISVDPLAPNLSPIISASDDRDG